MTALIFGSQLRPNRALCRSKLTELRNRTTALLVAAQREVGNEAALCEAHNAYVAYTGLCLLVLSGHRPVEDPFCYREAIADGFAVIEDKAVTERHARRIVILCDTAREQLRHYESHLRALASRLPPDGRFAELAPALADLVSEKSTESGLPFLFFLAATPKRALTDSISEGNLTAALGSSWPWPLNTGRHLIATRLRDAGVPCELIDFQMGHLLPERQLCASASTASVVGASKALAPALEAIAQDYGFMALPGLAPPRHLPPKAKRKRGTVAYAHGQLGPERRKADRAKAREEDRELVEKLCTAALARGIIDQVVLDEIAEQLIAFSASEPTRLGRRIGYLWDWALMHRQSDRAFRLPARYFTLLPPPCPFDRAFPGRYTRATRWRRAFADYLEQAGKQGKTPAVHERVAEIILSAALHGALIDADDLRQLADLMRSGAQRLGAQIFVEIPATKHKQASRWMADGVTAALISQAPQSASYAIGHVTRALLFLLQTLDPASRVRNPWKAIADQAAAYWQYQLPGFVFSSATREIASSSLPIPTMVRLLNGARLASEPSADVRPIPDDAIPTPVGGKGRRGAGTTLLKEARDAFTQIEKSPARGHARTNRNLNTALSNALRDKLKKSDPDTPAIAKLCVHWAIHLADEGTRYKPNLAFNTVERYFNAIARPLIDTASEEDFLNLDPAGYEEIYEQALLHREGREREVFAGRLLEFHAYLEDAWCVDSPDWSALPLPREQLAALAAVDANFLTPREYAAALNLLVTDPAGNPHTRLRMAALLVLGYRFGTRISDALRLQYQDLVLDTKSKTAIVHVHANMYGSPKSEAGNRQIPLIGTLSSEEWQVLTQLKGHFEERMMSEDPKASLFADPEAPREPIERRLLLDRIHFAMRTVSGDQTLRYHHLRHSFATRLGAVLFADLGRSAMWAALLKAAWDTPPDPRETRLMLTGIADISEDILQTMPCLLGHSAAQTSLQHYFHLMDALILSGADSDRPRLGVHAWSYVVGADHSTVRKRLFRRAKAKDLVPLGPGWYQTVPEISVALAKGRPSVKLPGKKKSAVSPDLVMTDRILLACAARDGKVDGIGDRLLLSEAQVQRVVDIGARLEARGGIARVSLAPAADRLFGRPEPRIGSSALKETQRLREGLAVWQERIKALTGEELFALKEALEAWFVSTLRSDGSALFSHRSHVAEVMRGLGLLGISGDLLQVVRPAEVPDPANSSATAPLVPELEKSAVKATKQARNGVVELRLLRSRSIFGYSATLYRALYVALVHLLSGETQARFASSVTPPMNVRSATTPSGHRKSSVS